MTNEPKYGPWIIWNGGEYPVGKDVDGQVQVGKETREHAMAGEPYRLCVYTWEWEACGTGLDVIAYRLLLEPIIHETIIQTRLNHDGGICILENPAFNTRDVRLTICGDEIKAEWVE